MKKIVLLSSVLAFFLHANEIKSLNDMTVTAQKTEENVQDVPISMSVFSDISLEDKKIIDLTNLSYYVPNFYLVDVGSVAGAYSPSMRGIYTTPALLSSSVGLYIDGVPTTNTVGFEAILEDIQRVEVLRGPQSALYGKNTEAGVINIITKKPDNNTQGKVSLEYGEDNKQEVAATIRTPIVKDKLFVGITGRYFAKDGNIENTYLNKKNDKKNYYGKIYLRATPTDRLELGLIASGFKKDDDGASINIISAEDFRKVSTDTLGFMKDSSQSYALKVDYEFDNFTLNSTTSYTKNVQDSLVDYDFTTAKMFNSKTRIDHKNLSQELKLDGKHENLKWLFGVFGSSYKKSGGITNISDYPEYAYSSVNDIDSTNIGVFTHLNYAFSDTINLIGGIRYDRDKSEIDVPDYMYKDEFSSNNISPKIALEYKINSNFLTYATVAKGYKSGGFYILADPNYSRKYDSETLWNYELGFKSTLFGGKLAINGDIFYMDINDMQVFTLTTTTGSGYISNAASATSYGFELDTNYIINDNFSIFGSFGYNESKFDDFRDALGSYNDNYTTFAPKYNYSLGGQFRGLGGFYASANIVGYGKMYLNNSNTYSQNAYALVNAKIGYEWDNFDIYVYGDNLFDKDYDIKHFDDNYILTYSDREIGVRFAYRF